MKSTAGILMVCAALLAAPAAQAARSAPLVNLVDVPVESIDGKPLTLAQVRKAIISAAATRKWTPSEKGPNKLYLTVSGLQQKHNATVEVTYTAKTYSIKYVDSTELNYGTDKDGKPTIHPNYNNWVNSLKQAINLALKTV